MDSKTQTPNEPEPVLEKHVPGRIDAKHPLGGEMSDVLRGLIERARLPWLLQHYARVPVLALFSFVNGCISIALMSVLALLTHSPFFSLAGSYRLSLFLYADGTSSFSA